MSDWKEIAQFAQEIAREAGHLIRQERDQQTVSLNYKTHQELVTSADLKSDQLIRSRIQQRFPEHQILSKAGARLFFTGTAAEPTVDHRPD